MGKFRRKKDTLVPEGTEGEMKEAYTESLEYQVRLLDFSDEHGIPEEIIAKQRRFLYYAIKGPRRGYFHAYKKAKLMQADILYIMTVTTPSKELSELFKVSVELINKIRGGKIPDWDHEFRLVRRIRTRIRGNMKQLHKSENSLTIYGIFKEDKLLQLITSKRKAISFRKDAYGRFKNYEEIYEIRELKVER